MPDRKSRWPDNKRGKYYVDNTCIDCDACRSEAPLHFKRNDEHGYSYVALQPNAPEEIERCEAALAACPVEAIGRDGEEGGEEQESPE